MREQTLLSRDLLARREGYLDWDTQPSVFKRYPRFLERIDLRSLPELQWLAHSRLITDRHSVAGRSYVRLNVPSAGNLHPVELYVQLRGISGVRSGIYHLETSSGSLVLIREIGSEGIEPAIGLERRFNGAIVLLSLVPFRAFWKYGLRSWRYLYLDLGHQIGSLEMSVRHFGRELTQLSLSVELSPLMGMIEGERIAAGYGVGEITDRPVRPLSAPLMRVAPCDYMLLDPSLDEALCTDPLYGALPMNGRCEPFEFLNRSRRSAREFVPGRVDARMIGAWMNIASAPSLEVLFVLFRVRGMHPGIYEGERLIREGEFRHPITQMLLGQSMILGTDAVVLIHARRFDAAAHVDAGIYGHNLYLACESAEMGCSGIGAFFDDEALEYSPHPLVYAIAIGGKR